MEFDSGLEATIAPAAKPAVRKISEEPSTRRRPVAPKTIRLRDKEHRRFVSIQPCLVCGRSPADAHHLRFAQPRALGRKVSDEFTVPLCRVHHRELHRHGAEANGGRVSKSIRCLLHAGCGQLPQNPIPLGIHTPAAVRAHDLVSTN
jgi:hypothetical protein